MENSLCPGCYATSINFKTFKSFRVAEIFIQPKTLTFRDARDNPKKKYRKITCTTKKTALFNWNAKTQVVHFSRQILKSESLPKTANSSGLLVVSFI